MNKSLKLFILSVLIVYLIHVSIHAERLGEAGITLSVLDSIAGTRAMGVGAAYTALADDITSLYWNPAGLGRLTRQQVYGLYEQLYEDTIYGFIGYSLPFYRIGVFGVGLIFQNTSHVPRWSPGEYPDQSSPKYLGEYSDTQSMLIISYGSPLDNIKKFKSRHFRFFDLGMSMKLVKHAI